MPSHPDEDQKSLDDRFDPEDAKYEEAEPDRGKLGDEEAEAGRGSRVVRNPADDIEDEELAEEDILEQYDIDEHHKGEGPDA